MTRLVFAAFPLLVAGPAAVAGPTAAEATQKLFSTECIRPLVFETEPNVDDFYAWSDQEVAQLSTQLGMQPDGFRFWTPNSTQDILVWSQTDPICQVIHIGYTIDQVEPIWPTLASRSEFRSKPSSKPGGAAQVSGFGAISVPENEFVQVSMHFRDFGQPGATLTMLTAVRVGQTPASCDLFPEECE